MKSNAMSTFFSEQSEKWSQNNKREEVCKALTSGTKVFQKGITLAEKSYKACYYASKLIGATVNVALTNGNNAFMDVARTYCNSIGMFCHHLENLAREAEKDKKVLEYFTKLEYAIEELTEASEDLE